MSLISKKQERYVLPAVVTLDLLAGWGYQQITNISVQGSNLSSRISGRHPRVVQSGVALALLVGQFALAWSARPYYSTFYNPLLGGAGKAQHLLLIGRGEGLERAVRYIQAEAGEKATQVASWYGTTVAVLFEEQVDVKDIGHPQYVLGSWVGFDEEAPLGRGETGSRAASPIWLNFMQQAMADLPVKTFKPPENIEFVKIDAENGLLPIPESKETILECFKEGTAPIQYAKRPGEVTETADFFKKDL